MAGLQQNSGDGYENQKQKPFFGHAMLLRMGNYFTTLLWYKIARAAPSHYL